LRHWPGFAPWQTPVGVRCCLPLLATALAAPLALSQEQPPQGPVRQLSLENKIRLGDFDQMFERRVIRVLLPFSRTLYFVDKGRERGITAENMRDFGHYLNKKHAKELGKRPITMVLIPTTRDRLFTGVTQGLGDVAAGDLTVTEERQKRVDFVVAKGRTLVRELVVTGPKSPEIKSLDDLSGKTEYVRASTSYAESLAMLSIGRSPGLAEGDVGVVTEWNYRKRMLAENSLLPTREGQAE